MTTEPARTRAWSGDVANAVAAQGSALATNRKVLREIVTVGLLAAGATVRYSCDSVVAGAAGDGVNRWDADTDLVFAAAGVAHSWIVLRLPEQLGDADLLIDLENSATGSVFSMRLSFTGFTGGSTTARPTAADEFEITVPATPLPAVDGTYDWHAIWAGDGSAVRLFLHRAGTIVASMMIERLYGAPTAWAVPVVGIWTADSVVSTWGCAGRHAGSTFVAEARSSLSDADIDLDGNLNVHPVWIDEGNTPLGPLGLFRDLYTVRPGTADATTIPSGTDRRWIVIGEFVHPWVGADLGGADADANVIEAHGHQGAILSLSPADGSSLGDDFEAARWMKITAKISIPEGYKPVVLARFGASPALWWTVYDRTAFAPLFADHSSVQVDGSEYTFTILPLGGWWDTPEIIFGVFWEAT